MWAMTSTPTPRWPPGSTRFPSPISPAAHGSTACRRTCSAAWSRRQAGWTSIASSSSVSASRSGSRIQALVRLPMRAPPNLKSIPQPASARRCAIRPSGQTGFPAAARFCRPRATTCASARCCSMAASSVAPDSCRRQLSRS